MSMSQSGFVVG